MRRIIPILAALIAVSCVQDYDVVVIGGGTGGTAAAIEASRMGARTLVVEEGPWLGGMLTSAGVSAVDGNYRLRGGIFGEYCDSLAARYGGYDALFSGWVSKIMFNPSVGAAVFANMASAAGVEVRFDTGIKGFPVKPGMTFSHARPSRHARPDRASPGWHLTLSDGTRIRARILIDGTELGDVAKAVGAAALQDSRAVQDMTYVLIVKEFDHDVSIPQPAGYDIENYRHCCDNPLAVNTEGNGPKGQQLWSPEMMLSYGKLPDGHIMLNWPVYGNDFYVEYLDMTPQERAKAVQQAKDRALGYLYFIQHELGYKNLGIADDVFPSADGLPFYPYYREARRIAGTDTMTVDAARNPYDYDLYTRAVAVGDYPVDHHHVQNPRWEELSHLWFGRIPSFSVPLGVTIPVETEDLIVADKAISVSWEMNGGTRLQPVILGIGQAAGALASLSVQRGLHPRQVPVRDVQEVLLDHGCYLLPFLDLTPSDPGFRQLQTAGIEGSVLGTGRSVGWSNETWVTLPD
ncbi:MAG: FAD-dependent oxidoreductase [Bacteroidales bacterium]|nr:FAD-dependent oxidoreductase [Bacteroidales bacterium]